MPKYQKEDREFQLLRHQLGQMEKLVRNSKTKYLWSQEAAVRKKLKQLEQMRRRGKEYSTVVQRYVALLDQVSTRLLSSYNARNRSSYDIEELKALDYKAYLSSGIISVLTTIHIPSLVSKEFERVFPQTPKEEYPQARKYKRKFYLHLGATNTGKTYNAIQRLKEGHKSVYLAPLRILALENFERLNREGVPCSLLTGEEEILVEGARCISSTVEKLASEQEYDVAVVDEIQMIDNSQRGAAWTRAVLGLRCPEIHLCGALNAKDLLVKIIEDCGDEYEIREYVRNTPLEVQKRRFRLKDATKGDALVTFSKRKVLELSRYYAEEGMRTSVIYGDLPPEVRRAQYNAFISGEHEVLITTDAIGMGVNLPIRRIVFMECAKFDGEDVRDLTTQEVKQIAGRAGRLGIYDVGYVAVFEDEPDFIRDSLETEDEPLEEAVLGPSEAILKVGKLPLKEKLALWGTRQEPQSFYRKMDVRDYLLILDAIKRYRLPEETQWRLMKIPFDVRNDEMLECFLEYVEELFVQKAPFISKPEPGSDWLQALETYYRMINVYYSMSKNFDLPFDELWVYEERRRVSDQINRQLLRL